MPIFRRLLVACAEARWWVIALAALVHVAVTWIGLALLGETALTGAAFGYYYLTTVTTVGYGDLSPESVAGGWFVGTWVMIGGIAVFTAVLGKAISGVTDRWRRRVSGHGSYAGLTGHTVVIGHEPGRTARLVAELKADDGAEGGTDDADIVVVATAESLEDGLPMADVRLVRTRRLADVESLRRAGLEGADRVLIYAEDDDVTLAACLAVSSVGADAHTVAYFDDAGTAALARHHCPRLETVSSSSEDLVVRATRDPGASAVLSTLVSATDDTGSLYSSKGSVVGAPCTVGATQGRLRAQRATLLAVAPPGGAPVMCMDADHPVGADDTVFYVARKRVA